MSNNIKQIFFIFVEQKQIDKIEIKDIENIKYLKKIKKLDSFEVDNKKSNFKTLQ
jgi:hypothetical protein